MTRIKFLNSNDFRTGVLCVVCCVTIFINVNISEVSFVYRGNEYNYDASDDYYQFQVHFNVYTHGLHSKEERF